MYARTNSDIPRLAIKGETATTRTGSFSTTANPRGWDITQGWLTRRLAGNIAELARAGRITQIIESYRTVIAFKLDGQWIRIDDTHSTTTSCKHETTLYVLPRAVDCPKDATVEELTRIAAGLMTYHRGFGKIGTYTAGPNSIAA